MVIIINFKKSLKNNLFIIKAIWEIDPLRIVFEFLANISLSFCRIIFDVLLIRYIVNSLHIGVPFTKILTATLVVVAINLFSYWFNDWYNQAYVPKSNEKIKYNLYAKLYKKSIKIDTECFDNVDFLNLYKKALDTCDKSIDILNVFSRLFSMVTSLVVLIGIITTLDWVMLIFAIVPALLSIPVGKLRNKVNYESYEKGIFFNRKNDYLKRVFYLNEYSKELKGTSLSEIIFRDFKSTNDDLIGISKKYGKKKFFVSFLESGVQFGFLITCSIVYIIYRVAVSKTLLIGDFMSLFFAITNTEGNLRGIFSFYPTLEENSLHIDNYIKLLNYTPIIENDEAKIEFKESFKEINLKNVSFKYPGSDAFALENINLSIKKNEKIAIVGYNGAGKSTLIKLLMRLYDPTSGDMYINRLNVKDISTKWYRTLFSTIFQDFKVIPASIFENITLSTYDEEKLSLVNELLKKVGLLSKVKSLKNGVNTNISKEFFEDGIDLSGGEKQKLIIARALYSDSEIVILDEPSSALDPLAEYELNNLVMNNTEDKTIIFISHRLSTTRLADKIYMFEDGKIIEAGSHDELMKLDGKYAEMFNVQSKSYVGESQSA